MTTDEQTSAAAIIDGSSAPTPSTHAAGPAHSPAPGESGPAAPQSWPAYDAAQYRQPGKDKLAIVGFAQSHRHLAPINDPSYEIWSLNNAYVHLKRADRWFEIHSEDLYGWDLRRPGDHIGWLKKFAGPVYMIEQRADIPNSVRFPIEDVISCVGPYLTSGPAYMLGLAMLEGFKHIEIYGIDLATATEYQEQKPGFEFLLGMAMGREIEIVLPRGCHLLKAPLYGRGDINEGGEHHTRRAFAGRLEALQRKTKEVDAQLLEVQLARARLEGAQLECQYWIGRTPEGGDPSIMLAKMSPIVAAKGAGGIGQHRTGDLADG